VGQKGRRGLGIGNRGWGDALGGGSMGVGREERSLGVYLIASAACDFAKDGLS